MTPVQLYGLGDELCFPAAILCKFGHDLGIDALEARML